MLVFVASEATFYMLDGEESPRVAWRRSDEGVGESANVLHVGIYFVNLRCRNR